MLLLKGCPRCGGDLHETMDLYGRYHQCIQCGHTADLPSAKARTKVTADKSREKTAA
ncbi:MAG: hypothetical protein WD533_00495 [Dehalococcoidia bacterium]